MPRQYDPDNPELAFRGLWLPVEILANRCLSHMEQKVLAVVLSYSKDKRGCFASNGYICELLAYKQSQIRECIDALVHRGYLDRQIDMDPKRDGGRLRFLKVTGRHEREYRENLAEIRDGEWGMPEGAAGGMPEGAAPDSTVDRKEDSKAAACSRARAHESEPDSSPAAATASQSASDRPMRAEVEAVLDEFSVPDSFRPLLLPFLHHRPADELRSRILDVKTRAKTNCWGLLLKTLRDGDGPPDNYVRKQKREVKGDPDGYVRVNDYQDKDWWTAEDSRQRREWEKAHPRKPIERPKRELSVEELRRQCEARFGMTFPPA